MTNEPFANAGIPQMSWCWTGNRSKEFRDGLIEEKVAENQLPIASTNVKAKGFVSSMEL